MFSEETADRARVALRDTNQKIWAMLAAVVVLVLFLLEQLEGTILSRPQQLVVANTFVATLFGYLLYMMIRSRRELSGYFDRVLSLASTEPDAGQVQRGFPLSWRGSMVFAAWTVAVAAWFTRDPSVSNPVISFFWNDLGSYLLMANAFLATVNAVRSERGSVHSAKPMQNPSPAMAQILQRASRLGSALVNILVVLLVAFFARYAIGGVAALFSEPPSWIPLGRLLGAGIVLYVFQFWLGSQFRERGRLAARLQRLETLHREIVGGQLTVTDARLRYAELLGARIPRDEPGAPDRSRDRSIGDR
jgi:hypothetical protein